MEVSNFPATLTLLEINIGWFQKFKNCRFNNFEASNFDFWKNFTLENVKIGKNSKFRYSEIENMVVLGASKWHKLVSHKIWIAEISWIFQIVYSQLGCPGLYLFYNWQIRTHSRCSWLALNISISIRWQKGEFCWILVREETT